MREWDLEPIAWWQWIRRYFALPFGAKGLIQIRWYQFWVYAQKMHEKKIMLCTMSLGHSSHHFITCETSNIYSNTKTSLSTSSSSYVFHEQDNMVLQNNEAQDVRKVSRLIECPIICFTFYLHAQKSHMSSRRCHMLQNMAYKSMSRVLQRRRE